MDEPRYRVVVNHEEQYSIWPEDRELPAGWRAEGTAGTRQQCLDHVDAVWTDLRPLSARTGAGPTGPDGLAPYAIDSERRRIDAAPAPGAGR